MTIDEAIKDLEYGSEQLEMEIKSGLWTKGSESELRCKEGITLNKQHIEWLKELKDLREENKVLIQKCDKLIKEKGADVQPVKHGRCVIDNEGYERCSICNEHESGMRYFAFCPRCGARLDSKDGDIDGKD